MTFAVPKFAAGIMLPNPAFVRGVTAGDDAENWYRSSNLNFTASAIYDTRLHRRGQRYTTATTSVRTVTSEFSRPYVCMAPVTTSFFYAVEWRSSSISGSWALKHYLYDSSGNAVLTRTPISVAGNSTDGDWELRTTAESFAVPSVGTPVVHGLGIELTAGSSSDHIWDFAFAGLGVAPDGTDANGYWSPERLFAHPGTDATPTPTRPGAPMPYQMNYRFEVDGDENLEFRRLHEINRGNRRMKATGASAQNPSGANLPILFITGAEDLGAPQAMYGDLIGQPPSPPMRGYVSDLTPYFDISLSFIERLNRDRER